jgi:membrane-bound serine protease (ClpP class)
MRASALLAVLLAVLVAGLRAAGAEEAEAGGLRGPFRRIHVVDFAEVIEPVLAAYVERSVERARAQGADAIVLRIDSPGGRVDSSLEIGDLLAGLPDSIHVVAWVPQHAYSGAALVALACDEIVMSRNAHLGDAQPILMKPDGPGYVPAGEKMESPLRAKFREYAEKNGYPPILAEAMVSAQTEVLRVREPGGREHFVRGREFRSARDEDEVVPGVRKEDVTQVGGPVVARGQLLTMTAREAADLGFLRRRFEGGSPFPKAEGELLRAISAPDATVVDVRMTFAEHASRALAGLLPLLGAIVSLALLLLLFQGPGVITMVGGVALALILLITLTADQLHGFPIFLLLVGGLLLVAEIFLIPGFGLPGIVGLAALAGGFILLAAHVSFGAPSDAPAGDWLGFGLQFVATLLGGVVVVVLLARAAPRLGFGRRLMLLPADPGAAPVVAASPRPRPGDVGAALSALRPAGTAEFGGAMVDVVSDAGFVEPGSRLRVVAVEGPTVFVRPASGEERP